MISHEAVQLACRNRLLLLAVKTTGPVTLGTTATGGDPAGASAYTRSAGSFITDGIVEGMEVLASGFALLGNNGVATVTAVSALRCTVDRVLAEEVEDVTRTLAVGLPSRAAWDNERFDPVKDNTPYVLEEYLPGPSAQISVGEQGDIDADPTYRVTVFVPTNTGLLASTRYTDALLLLFPPRFVLPLGNGDVIRVRHEGAPFVSQRQNRPPGWSAASITVPLRVRTTNII